MQAKAVAFELVAAHEIVGIEVKPWLSVHDVRYDLSKAASLVAIKHVLIRLQVTV